jgi:hypothetical protein
MLSVLGSILAALLAVAIILMGSRYLLDPEPAAAGFGIPGELGDTRLGRAWLAVKAALSELRSGVDYRNVNVAHTS